jgi:hypothetical protein
MNITLAELFDERDKPYFAELERIGEAIGYGRSQQILGELWDKRHNVPGRGAMGVTVRDERDEVPDNLTQCPVCGSVDCKIVIHYNCTACNSTSFQLHGTATSEDYPSN